MPFNQMIGDAIWDESAVSLHFSECITTLTHRIQSKKGIIYIYRIRACYHHRYFDKDTVDCFAPVLIPLFPLLFFSVFYI